MSSEDVKSLHICIAGSGMGGLSTALALAKRGFTHIDVFEIVSNLGFVGAGIQLAPNMARILARLGVWNDVEQEAVDVTNTSVRNGQSDEELAFVDLSYIRKQYDFPHMVGHRSSLANAIYDGCKRESNSIKFHFSTAISSVKSYGPRPTFIAQPRTGEPYEVTCDVLLAADGVKSVVREQMLNDQEISAKIVDTGSAAYRIMLSREQMQDDPDLLRLINRDGVTRWIGEKRHIIAYPVSSKQIYNLSTVQPDVNFAAAPSATYTTKGSKAQMLSTFEDFCPVVHKMLNLVPDGEVCEWKLRVHEPLPTWVHKQVALVGDACHPTLPHLNQGAAQAIEDAAVLGVVLSKLPDTETESINKALRIYEALRMERAYSLVELAAANGREMHLGEGKAKEARDKAFAALKNAGGKGPVPDKWADADMQRVIYTHDAMKAAEQEFSSLWAKLS